MSYPIAQSINNIKAAFAWAVLDIKCKYRRSVIGPFWETINAAVMIFGITYMTSHLFHADSAANAPYIGLGIIIWYVMTTVISESTGVFMQHKTFIRNSSLGVDVYVYRLVFRTMIIFAHHMVLYAIGLLFFDISVSAVNLMALVGLFFLMINACWVVPTIAFICTRYRDMEMVVRNLLQLSFFVTPIFWNYKTIDPNYMTLVVYNPFFYFLEAVRAPLLGETLGAEFYTIMLLITLSGYLLLALLYKTFRSRLAFYV